MKSRIITSCILVFLLLKILASCTKGSSPAATQPVYCQNITCQNNGTCYMNTCTCPLGYDGTYCDTVSRNRYIGTWVGTVYWQVFLENDSAADTFYMSPEGSDSIRVYSTHQTIYFVAVICPTSDGFSWYSANTLDVSLHANFLNAAQDSIHIKYEDPVQDFYGKKL